MKRNRQPRRNREFFEQNLNPNAANQMSEVCREAHTIYDIWDGGKGVGELFDYLTSSIGCSRQDADVICRLYGPAKAPDELCPLETIKNGNYKSVFERMSLQLPSINNNKGEGIWPKNLLAWAVMRKVFGEDVFNFELHGTGATWDNKILFPKLINGPDGNPLPFGLAALNAISVGEFPAHVVKKANMLVSSLGDVGVELTKMLLDADFILPPEKSIQQLIDAVRRGLGGETVILSGAFCPDYSYRESNQPGVKYEYTFKNVGSGIGLVAQQFVRVLPSLVEFFDKHSIKFQIKLGIGDFEANSQEILNSVGVSREEFIARCLMSLDAFRRKFPDIPMELVLFEEQWAQWALGQVYRRGSWCNAGRQFRPDEV